MTGKKLKEKERIQWGLLNYSEVHLSVTSRQLFSVLPTKVFLCGRSEGAGGGGVGGPAGWQTRALGSDGRPVRGNKNIKTLEAPKPNKKHICCNGNSSSQWEAAIKTEETVSATAPHSPQITPALQFSAVEPAGRADG